MLSIKNVHTLHRENTYFSITKIKLLALLYLYTITMYQLHNIFLEFRLLMF